LDGSDMVKNIFFGNGGTNLHILHVKDTCGHFKTGLIMTFDPQNMGLETMFFQLAGEYCLLPVFMSQYGHMG
jgi:hypothetical protein